MTRSRHLPESMLESRAALLCSEVKAMTDGHWRRDIERGRTRRGIGRRIGKRISGMRQHWFIGLPFALLVLFALITSAAPTHSAGLRILAVPADASGPEIIVSMWYPSPDKPAPVSFGDIP